VIIPLFNKAPYIRRALASVERQTFIDYEVIVVDDGSTDGGGTIVAGLKQPRLTLLTQENSGPGRARNRGLAEARGEFVAFLDADDEWLPEYLECSVNLLERAAPEAATVTSGYFEYPSGRSTDPLWRERGLVDGPHRLDPQTPPQLAIYWLAFMSPCSTMGRTWVFRRLGGFFARDRCTNAEDAFLFLKILLNHTIIVNLDSLVRIHREASDLSRRGYLRPIEPLLTHPDELRAACPPDLRDLLEKVLATRALKTACLLGYWGRWREARALCREFCPSNGWQLPLYWPARVLSTPLAPAAGKIHRLLLGAPKPENGAKGVKERQHLGT
jgi:GT2 family glycosyltransferase